MADFQVIAKWARLAGEGEFYLDPLAVVRLPAFSAFSGGPTANFGNFPAPRTVSGSSQVVDSQATPMMIRLDWKYLHET